MQACRVPGRPWSALKRAVPVTLPRVSRRGSGRAHQGIGRHRLGLHVRQVAVDALALDQLAIADLPGRIALDRDHAGFHLEPVRRDLEALAGHLQQHGPGLGGGPAQHRPELPDAQRAARAAVPGAEVGVAHEHVHPLQGHVQFLRRQHGQGGHVALAHLHLAHGAAHPAVRADVQVGVEVQGVARGAGRDQLGRGQGRVRNRMNSPVAPVTLRKSRRFTGHLPSPGRPLPPRPGSARGHRTGTGCPPGCAMISARVARGFFFRRA